MRCAPGGRRFTAITRRLFVLKLVAVLVCLAGGAFALYVAATWDRVYDAPFPALAASTNPAVIARGAYLVYGPAHCAGCHVASTAEGDQVAAGSRPPLRGGLAMPLGTLGVAYASNLTPDRETGIGRYSDGQLARTMRWAVRPDGRATISAMMPYGDMSDDDVVAVISYLRAQPPVRHAVPSSRFTLIGKIVKSFAPAVKPRTSVHPSTTAPAEEPTRARGEYLARTVANCVGCHTPRDPLTCLPTGPEFSGGLVMAPSERDDADPGIRYRTPNLTPAKGSALSKFPDRATFVARFLHGGRQHAGSPMPWEFFGRLSEADAGALYQFLSSLPEVPEPADSGAIRTGS